MKEAGIDLGENDFGYVFAQGKATDFDDITNYSEQWVENLTLAN